MSHFIKRQIRNFKLTREVARMCAANQEIADGLEAGGEELKERGVWLRALVARAKELKEEKEKGKP